MKGSASARRLANRDLDIGAIVALAPNLEHMAQPLGSTSHARKV